ncbi:hypothetical protein [Nonomuraea sp. WAC 01424]|uniref:hypothetical protein n=1 Tax=Nonomuraea sp. WAC 01424 TaxID=2203200 RepID=UPI000F7768E7|nr:hypothetical protein [Nonomuraea sp. WAC 01424]
MASSDRAATPADERLARDLCDVLAEGYNIPAYIESSADRTLVVLNPGLTARCEGGLIWWTYASGPGSKMLTYAHAPLTAAARLVLLYATAVHCPPAAMSPGPLRRVRAEG